ncbi:MAG: phosphatase PAP2 family protein [Oscillospiraceae bacterium]|nr:phosphatase PAP2 family protein [Oscillospiraceae bacterium]
MIESIRALLDALAVSFDLPVLDWIAANLWCPALDIAMPIITVLGDAGIFWIALSVLFMITRKYRKTGIGMMFALLMGLVICNIWLKPTVARIRPYDFQEEYLSVVVNLLIEKQHDFSFPSGHTIASFEAAVVILLNNKKLGIPAMILACLIAFSRLYLYVHYPTDVICSILLGTAFAFIGNWLAGKVMNKLPEKLR